MNQLIKSSILLGLSVINVFAFSFSDLANQIENTTKGVVKVTFANLNNKDNSVEQQSDKKEKESSNLNYSENNLNFYTIEGMNSMNFSTALYFDDELKSYNQNIMFIQDNYRGKYSTLKAYRKDLEDWQTSNNICKSMDARLPSAEEYFQLFKDDRELRRAFLDARGKLSSQSRMLWTRDTVNNRYAKAIDIFGDLKNNQEIFEQVSTYYFYANGNHFNPRLAKTIKQNKAVKGDYICIKYKKGKKFYWDKKNHKIPVPQYKVTNINASDGDMMYVYKSLHAKSKIDFNFDYAYDYCKKKNMRLPRYEELKQLYEKGTITDGIFITNQAETINFYNDRLDSTASDATYVKCVGYK